MEQTDFKNVIVENIHWALFEDAEDAEKFKTTKILL